MRGSEMCSCQQGLNHNNEKAEKLLLSGDGSHEEHLRTTAPSLNDFKKCLDFQEHGVTLGDGHVQGQELDLMILQNPFQLSLFTIL